LSQLPEGEQKKKLQWARDYWESAQEKLSPQEKEEKENCSSVKDIFIDVSRDIGLVFGSPMLVLGSFLVITFFTFILGRAFYSATDAPIR
jgi:hypothetical protein